MCALLSADPRKCTQAASAPNVAGTSGRCVVHPCAECPCPRPLAWLHERARRAGQVEAGGAKGWRPPGPGVHVGAGGV